MVYPFSLQIFENDALPKVLCKSCFRQVEATATISKIAKHTQQVFRDFLFSSLVCLIDSYLGTLTNILFFPNSLRVPQQQIIITVRNTIPLIFCPGKIQTNAKRPVSISQSLPIQLPNQFHLPGLS